MVALRRGTLAGMDVSDAEGLEDRAARLHEVLAQIDAGALEASGSQRAFLAGPLATLEELEADQ